MKNARFLTRLARAGLVMAMAPVLTALPGCASRNAYKADDTDLRAVPQGPGNLPQRNLTDFSNALRCMDDTLMAFGTRDLVIVVEELQDQTRRLGAGTRDMMVSAFSDMTRRSRAIRLVTFGQDNQNVVFLLQQLEKRTPFGVLPQYDIRGSVTQFDEDVIKRDINAGANFGFFNARGSRTTAFNVLGFDASVISVPDLTLVPGVSSKNTVIVGRDERSADSSASIRKAGLTFNMQVSTAAGTAQALRNMVELASIELVGKLARVPYWGCLNVSKDNPDIRREIEDWFFSMRDATEVNKFFQEHLRNRKFFDGPLDGQSSPALDQALRAYKRGLKLAENATVDVKFFAQFLNEPVPAAPREPFTVAAKADNAAAPAAVASGSTSAKPAVVADATATSGALGVVLTPLKQKYRVNEEVEFGVQLPKAGYLYCYVTPSTGGAIQRVFPNRNVKDPRVEANDLLVLPGDRGFKLTSPRAGTMQIGCLAAPREVYNDLPPPLRWGDFEDIGLNSFEAVKQGFEKAGKTKVAMDVVTIKFE
jgi:hypothetical protein